MKRPEPKKSSNRIVNDRMTQLGLTIPTSMLGGIIFGLLLAWGVTVFDFEPKREKRVQIVCVFIGMLSGFYEAGKAIRKISKPSKQGTDDGE